MKLLKCILVIFILFCSITHVIACRRILSYSIIPIYEEGEFEFPTGHSNIGFYMNVNKTEYPDLEVYFDGNKVLPDSSSEENELYNFNKFMSILPRKTNVKIISQNNVVYSGQLKFKDNSISINEIIICVLLSISIITTFVTGILAVFKKIKIIWLIIPALITTLLVILNLYC